MRVLGLVAALVMLSTLPPASAQVPEPSEVVDLACATLGGVEPQARDLVPFCPRDEPVAQPAAEAGAPAPPSPPGPPSPEDVAALARDIVDEAQAIPEDPASAGDRILAIVAIALQFVKDLLSLPAAVGDAIASVGSSARDVVASAAAAIASLFDGAPDAPATSELPVAKPRNALPDAARLLDRVSDIVPR